MSLQFSNPHNFQYFILFFHHPYLKYSTFYERVVNIQEKLEYSTDIISKTKVLDKYLQAMTKPVSRHYLIQFHIIKLNLHVSHQGHINSHPNLTIHTIYQHFVATNLTVEFQLKSNKKFRANISQFTTHNTNKTSVGLQKCVINNDLSSYVLHDDKDEKKSSSTIKTSKHSAIIQIIVQRLYGRHAAYQVIQQVSVSHVVLVSYHVIFKDVYLHIIQTMETHHPQIPQDKIIISKYSLHQQSKYQLIIRSKA